MGSCGCGDFCADYRLPGPDGSVYSIRTYLACNNGCDTPHSVIVYRFSTLDSAKEWGVDSLPELPFGTFNGKPYEGNDAWLPVIHPRILKEHMMAWVKPVAKEYDPEGAVEDAVEHCLTDAVIATMEPSKGKRRRKAK
jgi:hypothetical protein